MIRGTVLERMKELPVWKDANGFMFLTVDIADFEWLYEQAARSQELERDLNDVSVWNHGHRARIHKLKKQNKRYREALEYYAGESHFDYAYGEYEYVEDGEIAREALEGEK